LLKTPIFLGSAVFLLCTLSRACFEIYFSKVLRAIRRWKLRRFKDAAKTTKKRMLKIVVKCLGFSPTGRVIAMIDRTPVCPERKTYHGRCAESEPASGALRIYGAGVGS
jgi:hypothetical protein